MSCFSFVILSATGVPGRQVFVAGVGAKNPENSGASHSPVARPDAPHAGRKRLRPTLDIGLLGHHYDQVRVRHIQRAAIGDELHFQNILLVRSTNEVTEITIQELV